MTEQNPQIASLLENQASSLLGAGVTFFGFDAAPEVATAGLNSVNVLKQSLGFQMSLDFFLQISVGTLENLADVVKPISQRRVNLTAGEAGELAYRMNLSLPTGQPVKLAITQYVVIEGRDVYIISLGTTAGQAEKYAPVFEKVAQSFRLIEVTAAPPKPTPMTAAPTAISTPVPLAET